MWCVVVLSLIATSSAMADENIRISFPNSVVGLRRTGNVLVVVHYKDCPDKKMIRLEWDPADEDGIGGSSETDLRDPANSGKPMGRDLDLPAGEYTFTATLIKRDGSEVKVKETRFVTR